MRLCSALLAAALLSTVSTAARAEDPESKLPPPPHLDDAIFVELATGFIPLVNDVPLMLGVGVRARGIHELWTRVGYMSRGDDVGRALGMLGYRAALRPGRFVRPIVGGVILGMSIACAHDALGRPTCVHAPFFAVAATGGVRLEPTPWFGLSALLSLGVDSYPNPAGMAELAATFTLPLR